MKDLSLYYVLSILRNKNSLEGMKEVIWATFYRKISTDTNPQHAYCPSEANAWCKYRQAKAANTLKGYKHPLYLDEETQMILKSVYDDLSSDGLLQRYVEAHTQNNNKSFNACVWHLAPKHTFTGKKIVEIASYCAASEFNEGFEPILKILETINCFVGAIAINFVEKNDNWRVSIADQRSSAASKEQRVALRNARLEEDNYYEETKVKYME